ncbi:MAG: hypothetical protein HWN68_05925 [Desulfobacterales bacterium]|nr:hypothetical protein [Desulfobacterales bacterium]
MSKAVKCPVCEGTGQLYKSDFNTESIGTCHACQGRGWVEVSETTLELSPAQPDIFNVNITLPSSELPPELGRKILEILRKEIEKGEVRQDKEE